MAIIDSLFNALTQVLTSEHQAEREQALEVLKNHLEIQVWAERLKYDAFRSLLDQRVALYKRLWKELDPVSYDRWHKNSAGVPEHIETERVQFLRHYLVELNENDGYLLDAVSRAFLLDLRWWCKECSDRATELGHPEKVYWLEPGQEQHPESAHGVKLWILKSGLRRSIVRALQAPEAGDPSYMAPDEQGAIIKGVRETIEKDIRRFAGPKSTEVLTVVGSLESFKGDENSVPELSA